MANDIHPYDTTGAQAAGEAALTGERGKARYAAAVVDGAIATVLGLGTALVAGSGFVSSVAWFSLAALAYYLIPEALAGRTVGKKLFGLRVVRLDGRPAGWREALWRTVFRVFEVNPIVVAGLPAALTLGFSERNQRLGDMVAGTVVAPEREADRAMLAAATRALPSTPPPAPGAARTPAAPVESETQPSVIRSMVELELKAGRAFNNVHGVTAENIGSHLVTPFQVLVEPDKIDADPAMMWVVLEVEKGESAGRSVVYDEASGVWGVAERLHAESYRVITAADTLSEALDEL